MIIEKIEIENFMCYSGYNIFEFCEGINVIIGDNAYGKSKLYDAFYWVLYDQIFVSERKEFVNTAIVGSELISDKVKYESVDGEVSASVSITFNNKEQDRVYVLRRTYTAKIEGGEVVKNNNKNSVLIVIDKEMSFLSGSLIDDENQKQLIINKILPRNLKRYLWFQGEQVESIIDFNDQGALTSAINVLSNMSYYETIVNIAKRTFDEVNNEYNKKLRNQSRDIEQSVKLDNQKKTAEQGHRNTKVYLDQTKENIARAEEKCELLFSKVADAEAISKFNQKIKKAQDELAELKKLLDNENSNFIRALFQKKWLLKGMNSIGKEYEEKFFRYDKNKLEKINKKQILSELTSGTIETRLPINVPEPIYVKEMLDKERCLVCGREAKKDSDAWKAIEELLITKKNTADSNVNDQIFKNNFREEFYMLYRNHISIEDNKMPFIEEEIKDSIICRRNLKIKIIDLQNIIIEQNEKIHEIIGDSSIDCKSAEHILNEYAVMRDKKELYILEKNKWERQIADYILKIEQLNTELGDLVKGEIPNYLIEKKKILSDFLDIATSTRDRVFNGLVSRLENEANVHYTSMTKGNQATRGKIRLKKLPNGNYMPEIIDDEGRVMLGYNTGNLILIKLATIMAIVSASSTDNKVKYYTLITDAPFSVFGDDYTIGFCKAVSMVYRQSIIMSKEFYKNEALKIQLMNDSDINIGRVYMIRPSSIECERDNRNNLSTIIESLN
jgi:DNA sulfur modification protein DndD